MTQPRQPRDRRDFQIAIICALPLEATAVVHQFDSFWGETGNMIGQAPGDPNAYTQGVIGLHNVVLAHPPSMGKGSAAGVAASIGSSFLGIELALVVGICGGVPTGTGGKEIRLGDVVISDGIIEYDFRKQYPDRFVRKNTMLDSLGRPNPKIRSLFNKLKEDWSARRLEVNTSKYLIGLQQQSDRYRYPGVETDKLFEPSYRHKHHDSLACTMCSKCEKKEGEVCRTALDLSCSDLKCNETNLVPRSRLSEAYASTSTREPVIHYGLIASGDTVMKSGEDRDAIAKEEGVIAFEMEGAGVWDKLPCVVIKGVCDYADSHKSKEWQNYAAAAAASCMKAFLKEWISTDKPSQSIAPPSK
jgi:nucleoside phosphorylase